MPRNVTRFTVAVPGSSGDLIGVSNAAVNIHRTGTVDLPVMYAGPAGGSPLTNPVLSSSDGEIEVWFDSTETGLMDFQITSNGGNAYAVNQPNRRINFATRVEVWQSASGIPGPPGPGGTDDPNAVKLTGDQTVNGHKTFLATTTLPVLDSGGQAVDPRTRGAVADGTTDAAAAINAADLAALAAGTPVVFAGGTYLVGSDLALNSAVRIQPGAKIKPGAGHTVTINGPIDAGIYKVFDLSAGGTVRMGSPQQQVMAAWWGAAHNVESSDAIQAAINAVEGLVTGDLIGPSVILHPAYYLMAKGVVIMSAVSLRGQGAAIATRLIATSAFPVDGDMIKVDGTLVPLVDNQENHLNYCEFKNFAIDGNGRKNILNGFNFVAADRMNITDVQCRFIKGSVIKTLSWRESIIVGMHTWLCGDTTHPVLDLFDQGTVQDGNNLNHFIGCQFALNLGNHVRAGTHGTNVVRTTVFNSCVMHGMNEPYETYTDPYWGNVVMGEEGGYCPQVIVSNARDISFNQCRLHLTGRAQPMFVLKPDPTYGPTSINTLSISQCNIFPRGGAFGGTVASVDATANTISSVAFGGPSRALLATGSRINFLGTPPAPLVASTDYYAIKVSSDLFSVASSRANAVAGTAIDLTGTTSGATYNPMDFGVTAVDVAANTLTTADHRLSTGARLRIAVDGAGAVPTGLVAATDYFAIRVDKDTIKLATTRANADAGTAIDVTAAGSGNLYLTMQEFLAELNGSSSLLFGGGCLFDGIPNRGWFRCEDTASHIYVDVMSNSFAGATFEERGAGALSFLDIPYTLRLPTNLALTTTDSTLGHNITLARVTAGNVAILGNGNADASVPTTTVVGATGVNISAGGAVPMAWDSVGTKLNNLNRIIGGAGVPAAGLGSNGDFYFRSDGTAGSLIYFRAAGAWTAIA